MTVKERMAKAKISQVEMMLELRKRGYEVQPPMMSSILRGVYTYPKAKEILSECENVLDDREKQSI
ncbi:MAG: hypothetical protein KH972_08995 [Peptostreptococcaceae bacterium]|nr:hypothetical protein [Peptostreptococcaceae bacterium]